MMNQPPREDGSRPAKAVHLEAVGLIAARTYPGDLAGPDEIRRLADEYRNGAYELQKLGRRDSPMSHAPYRLCAIHGIELYLNALLLHWGREASCIRGLQHNLAARAQLAIAGGLQLRQRTAAHLKTLSENREYIATRYGAEMTGTYSAINRIAATLEEVAMKVTAIICRGGG
jgi:hypothetical protein